jgi:phage baseplate assembly protein W
MAKQLNIRDRFAYDLSKDIINEGEIWDVDVINQSIEMIIGTSYGERLFNIGFGSTLSLSLFETMSNSETNRLIKDLIKSIELWEDRVTILSSEVSLISNSDNSLTLYIPYSINKNNIKSIFQKKLIT